MDSCLRRNDKHQETVFIGVNQCLIKLQKLLSDTELHGFTQILIFSLNRVHLC